MSTLLNKQYEMRIQELEHELDEMTTALSQAWDQLVPFLQELPEHTETEYDIKPLLQAVSAAVDTEMTGIYLTQSEAWYAVPDQLMLTQKSLAMLAEQPVGEVLKVALTTGVHTYWVFAPVISEGERIGMLGVGTSKADRVFTSVELRILTRMADRIGGQIAAAQLARYREREAVQEREMQIANDIQQSVLPREAPQNRRIQISAHWQPAKKVGGDAWGWVQRRDERLAWFILDVAGKGLPAALAAVSLHTALSMSLKVQMSPVDVLRTINDHFYDAYTQTDLMATVAVMALNPETGALEIANAGHPPILVRHKREWLRLAATAPPIGVLPTLRVEPQVIMLQPNDMIISYSDGITEIQTPDRLWGQTGLLQTVPKGARDVHALTRHIVAASKRVGDTYDDLTLVTAIYTNG